MGERISLALLGGAVLTEAVRFLFDQASALIRAARQRRAEAQNAVEPNAVVTVAVPANSVLDGPVAATVDGRLLDEENRRLIALAGAIARYASGDAEIDPADGDLMAAVAEVRAMLEALYGQRITLRGEAREPSGTQVDVNAGVSSPHRECRAPGRPDTGTAVDRGRWDSSAIRPPAGHGVRGVLRQP